MADDWKQQWKTAKKTFEDATNRNKPSQPFMVFFAKSTGIEQGLADCEKAHENLHAMKLIVTSNPKTPVTSIEKEALVKFTKAVLAYKPKAEAYLTGVQKSLDGDKLKDKIKEPTKKLLEALKAIGASLDDEIKFWTKRQAGA